jgi:hypothetical protein
MFARSSDKSWRTASSESESKPSLELDWLPLVCPHWRDRWGFCQHGPGRFTLIRTRKTPPLAPEPALTLPSSACGHGIYTDPAGLGIAAFRRLRTAFPPPSSAPRRTIVAQSRPMHGRLSSTMWQCVTPACYIRAHVRLEPEARPKQAPGLSGWGVSLPQSSDLARNPRPAPVTADIYVGVGAERTDGQPAADPC